MKNVNFLNTFSPKQHNELLRWYRISCALIIVLVLAGIFIELKQWNYISNLKAEFEQLKSNALKFDQLMTTKQKLKKEELELQSKMNVINEHIANTPKVFNQVLLIGRNGAMQLESLSVDNHNISINAYCNSAQDATGVMQRCNLTNCFNQLKLTAMHPKISAQKSMIHISLKGTLKTFIDQKQLKIS